MCLVLIIQDNKKNADNNEDSSVNVVGNSYLNAHITILRAFIGGKVIPCGTEKCRLTLATFR